MSYILITINVYFDRAILQQKDYPDLSTIELEH